MALFEDDEPPTPKGLVPMDLDEMSIEALEDYVGALQAEIERVKTKIDAKQEARGAAEGFFKK